MEDIVLLSTVGIKVVLVQRRSRNKRHAFKNRQTAKFIGGMRYTDEETMEIVQMVLAGKVNKAGSASGTAWRACDRTLRIGRRNDQG